MQMARMAAVGYAVGGMGVAVWGKGSLFVAMIS